jgi:hypothetical protein
MGEIPRGVFWAMGLKRFKLFRILFLLAVPSVGLAQVNGDGLQAIYYNGVNFNTAVVTEVDPAVEYFWEGCPPNPGVSGTAFSVKWTGQMESDYSQPYTITSAVDGGVSVIVNNQVLVSQWIENTTLATFTGTFTFTAGTKVPIEVDYFANGGSPQIQLLWQSASQPLSPIPHENLFSGTSPAPTPIPQTLNACQQTAVVDGVLDEWAWNTGAAFTPVTKTVSGQTFGSSALVKLLWDSNNLYLGAKVTDSQLTNTGTPSLWHNSAVELYLNTANDRSLTITSNDFEYFFRWNDTVPVESNGRVTGVVMKTTTTSGGYLVEAAIPWTTLGITPQDRTQLGFDVGVDVNHNGGNCRDGQLMLNGNEDNYLNAAAYAGLSLGSACPTPVATPPAAVNLPYVYSNPTSGPTVKFVYTMAQAGKADIKVWNAWGNLAAVINEPKGAGEASSSLDVSSFAPGHYFYRVVLHYDSGQQQSFQTKILAVKK